VRNTNSGVRLAIPMAHAAFPRNAAQLRDLGVGYANCAPTPEVRLLHAGRACGTRLVLASDTRRNDSPNSLFCKGNLDA
jgi:hypothetical protein